MKIVMYCARVFLMFFLISLVAGCAQNNVIKVRPDEIKLIAGETTKEDLIDWFGKQSKVVKLDNGNESHEFIIKGNRMKGGVLVGHVTGASSGFHSGAFVGALFAGVTLGASLVLGPIIGAGIGALVGLFPEDDELYPVQLLISEFNPLGHSVGFMYRSIGN